MLIKIKKHLIKRFDKISPIPIFYRSHTFEMKDNEIMLFDKAIKYSKYYLEFGLGGSTFRALLKSKAIIYSIESSLFWIQELKKYRYIRFMEKRRLNIFHVNIGETRNWGYPVDNTCRSRFPDYSGSVFNHLEKEKIDTVLIDGRFRVACALKTILECKNNDKLQILIHDWHRSRYHILLNYLVEIDRAGSLGFFKQKKDIDFNSVYSEYEKYKFNPK